MIQAGLYTPGADPVLDEAVERWRVLDDFVGTVTRGNSDLQNFATLREILGFELEDSEDLTEAEATAQAADLTA